MRVKTVSNIYEVVKKKVDALLEMYTPEPMLRKEIKDKLTKNITLYLVEDLEFFAKSDPASHSSKEYIFFTYISFKAMQLKNSLLNLLVFMNYS